MTTIPIALRAPTAEDLPLILNSWLESHREEDGNGRMSNDVYFAIHKPRIVAILQRATTLIAANPDDPWQVYGWICYEGGVVHYVYVKYHSFRRMRVATRLMAEAGNPRIATATGRLWDTLRQAWGVSYDPRGLA